jgi:2,3-bisphosphoglycerate-independent phosphoglycerate mutase
MAALMIVLDGMQDTPYPELGGLTPYEKGRGENFRALEEAAAVGKLATTPPGFEPDTQTCILTLLGVDTPDIPTGRSYIEALAQGLEVGDDDLVERCNFVEVDERGILPVPCCNAPDDIAETLREAVRGEGHIVVPVGPYKSLQIIKHGRKYLDGMKMNLPHMHQGEPFDALLPKGNPLADTLADFSREMLRRHAPYTVFNWAQAVKGTLPAFSGLHGGIRGGMVTKTDAPIGVAAAMGMECPALPTATGDTDTDIAAKVAATLDLLSRNDFVMLHVGGPDEATHRQDVQEKAAFIAKLDRELLAPILEKVPDGTRIMVTCDHVGLCSTAGHTDEPVEYWLYEKGSLLFGDRGVVDGKEAIAILMSKP